MTNPATQLAATLKAPLPDAFDQLGDADHTELQRLLTTALQRRGDALDTAIANSLDIVPRLMRPAVKKALGL